MVSSLLSLSCRMLLVSVPKAAWILGNFIGVFVGRLMTSCSRSGKCASGRCHRDCLPSAGSFSTTYLPAPSSPNGSSNFGAARNSPSSVGVGLVCLWVDVLTGTIHVGKDGVFELAFVPGLEDSIGFRVSSTGRGGSTGSTTWSGSDGVCGVPCLKASLLSLSRSLTFHGPRLDSQ